ncbi:hypothetical protein ACOME3_000453 [Neoechinorhynchus agilis]
MSEHQSLSLHRYRHQLEQVELALLEEPTNSDMLSLKSDLEEAIRLTSDLLEASGEVQITSVGSVDDNNNNNDDVQDLLRRWKCGDRCLAIWSGDKQYYIEMEMLDEVCHLEGGDGKGTHQQLTVSMNNATVDEIFDKNGMCTVVFDRYETTEIVSLASLKPISSTTSGDLQSKLTLKQQRKAKREKELRQREAWKKKQAKKLERIKQLEDAREAEKKRWKDFNQKLASKTWKGVVSKCLIKKIGPQEEIKGVLGTSQTRFKANGYIK